MTSSHVVFGESALTIEDITAIAEGQSQAKLSRSDSFLKTVAQGSEFLETLLKEDGEIYGVTTGYGDSCTVTIPSNLVAELPEHLYTFHGCGLGRHFNLQQARAIVACRLNSLTQGYSGASLELLEQLQTLLQHDIIPVIPEEGSVGASGDLTPLSYLTAVLCGERQVYYKNELQNTGDVFKALNITPHQLRPKEGLALMNGTAVMTALACLAYSRVEYLAQLCTRITAMMVLATKGNAHHFDERLFAVKPHPGQQQIAAWLRQDLNAGEPPRNSKRLQDRYSLRCAPHIIGVVQDSLPWWRQFIENELNSANDNPIIDAEGEHVLHGGHFYGGHIAQVMDAMKIAAANLADLLDRQVAQLLDTKFNHGLPANLSGATGERAAINHGFKAVQIGCSAWAAEALKNTMPASVFSRSTECHNQDKVSMGTIAARDCLRIIELTEQVGAGALIIAAQGLELRLQLNQIEKLDGGISTTFKKIREISPFLTEDRALEAELRQWCRMIANRQLALYPSEVN